MPVHETQPLPERAGCSSQPHPPCSFSFMLLVAVEGESMHLVSGQDNVWALLP